MSQFRVKVYLLQKEEWCDNGTGVATYAQLMPDDASKCIHSLIVNEEGPEGKELLHSEIPPDRVYERQGDKIIMWHDPSQDADCALSFQDIAGCNVLWETIERVQSHLQSFVSHTNEDGVDVKQQQDVTDGTDFASNSGIVESAIMDNFEKSRGYTAISIDSANIVNKHHHYNHDDQQYGPEGKKLVDRHEDQLVGVDSNSQRSQQDYETNNAFQKILHGNSLPLSSTSSRSSTPQPQAVNANLLPEPVEANLEDIRDLLRTVTSELLRRRYVERLLHNGGQYIKRIAALFHDLTSRRVAYLEVLQSSNEEKSVMETQIEVEKTTFTTSLGDAASMDSEEATIATVDTERTEPTAPLSEKGSPSSKNQALIDTYVSLAHIAEVLRAMILIGSDTIVEITLSTDVYETLAGAMEYDPSLPRNIEFRAIFKKKKACLVEVASLQHLDNNQFENLHRLMKLRLLRDCFVRPGIEEIGGKTLEMMVSIAVSDACDSLFRSQAFLTRMMVIVEYPAPTADNNSNSNSNNTSLIEQEFRQSGTLRLLREMFFLSKNLSFDRRRELYDCISKFDLCGRFFGMCSNVLQQLDDDHRINRAMIVEILSIYSAICPEKLHDVTVRGPAPRNISFEPPVYDKDKICEEVASDSKCLQFVAAWNEVAQRNSLSLLWILISGVIFESDENIVMYLGDILKNVIDMDKLLFVLCSSSSVGKDKFLSTLYGHYIQWITLPFFYPSILVYSPWIIQKRSKSTIMASCKLLVEVLSMCVMGHTYRMKYHILRTNLPQYVLQTTSRAYKAVLLSSVSFLKCIIASKDENDIYLRHIAKQDLFRPVLEKTKKSPNKGGIIGCAMLELLHLISDEGLSTLIEYVVDDLPAYLEHPFYDQIFKKLKAARDNQSKTDDNIGDESSNSISMALAYGAPESDSSLGDISSFAVTRSQKNALGAEEAPSPKLSIEISESTSEEKGNEQTEKMDEGSEEQCSEITEFTIGAKEEGPLESSVGKVNGQQERSTTPRPAAGELSENIVNVFTSVTNGNGAPGSGISFKMNTKRKFQVI